MSASRLLSTATPFVILAVAGMGLASAQSSSPFATKKKQQAWDMPVPTAPQTAAQPSTYQPYSAPNTAPVYPRGSSTPPTGQPVVNVGRIYQPEAPAYAPMRTNAQPLAATKPVSGSDYNYNPRPAPVVSETPDFGKPISLAGGNLPPGLPRQASPYQSAPPSASPYAPQRAQTAQAPSTATPNYGSPYGGGQSIPPQAGYQQPYPPTGQPSGQPYPNQGPTSYPAPQRPQSWKDRLGLGNLATMLRGKFSLGAAATYRDQPPNQIGPDDAWSEDFIGDAEVEFEVSAITQGGLEYGINLAARAQHDAYRRGFGGRLADCPPSVAGCSGLKGHTSQFYTVGEDTAEDFQAQLESAHIFLRSAYGDVTVGRDDGAAYLFSLGAPTLLAIGASNSPVDYTGYDSVKTVNDASGFAEKITYTSPRLLGDQIGVGVQLGVSYALKADACGVDYCVDRDIAGLVRPEIEDVFEAGLALDRTFENGMSVEGTFSYARGAEKSGFAGLDDLQSYGAGLELGYGDWTLGGSWLQSNNGLLDGDYTAYDAGVTWKPGALGFTLNYGHAEDENVNLTSDQAVFGVTYDFDKFTLGTGVQYVNRTSDGLVGGVLTPLDQTATSAFVQGSFKF